MKKLLLAAFGLVSLFGFSSRAMAHDCDRDYYRGHDYYRYDDYRRDRDERCRWEEERRYRHYDSRCDDDRRWDEHHHHHGFRGFLEGFLR